PRAPIVTSRDQAPNGAGSGSSGPPGDGHASPDDEAAVPVAVGAAARAGPLRRVGRRRSLLVAAGGVVAAAAVVGGGGLIQHVAHAHGVRMDTPTLAVLPFAHDGPADDQYLATGMTDDIRSRLAALPGLRVIAATSADQYTG